VGWDLLGTLLSYDERHDTNFVQSLIGREKKRGKLHLTRERKKQGVAAIFRRQGATPDEFWIDDNIWQETMLLKFLVNKTTFLKAYLKKTEQEKLAPKIVRQKLDFSGNPKLWENRAAVKMVRQERNLQRNKGGVTIMKRNRCCCRTTNKYIELDSIITSKGWKISHQRTTRVS